MANKDNVQHVGKEFVQSYLSLSAETPHVQPANQPRTLFVNTLTLMDFANMHNFLIPEQKTDLVPRIFVPYLVILFENSSPAVARDLCIYLSAKQRVAIFDQVCTDYQTSLLQHSNAESRRHLRHKGIMKYLYRVLGKDSVLTTNRFKIHTTFVQMMGPPLLEYHLYGITNDILVYFMNMKRKTFNPFLREKFLFDPGNPEVLEWCYLGTQSKFPLDPTNTQFGTTRPGYRLADAIVTGYKKDQHGSLSTNIPPPCPEPLVVVEVKRQDEHLVAALFQLEDTCWKATEPFKTTPAKDTCFAILQVGMRMLFFEFYKNPTYARNIQEQPPWSNLTVARDHNNYIPNRLVPIFSKRDVDLMYRPPFPQQYPHRGVLLPLTDYLQGVEKNSSKEAGHNITNPSDLGFIQKALTYMFMKERPDGIGLTTFAPVGLLEDFPGLEREGTIVCQSI